MRHPLTLLTDEVPALRLEPGHACLILQDVHNPLADPDAGWLARRATEKVLSREFDEYFDMVRLVAPNFRILADACRASGIDVVYVSLGVNGESSGLQTAMGWEWRIDGPDWGFPEAWSPAADDHVFNRGGWGALGSSECSAYIYERGIEAIIIAGTLYDYGIRHTCYQLADRGIASLVASDAVAALTYAGQSHTSGNLAHGLTKLRSTAEILDLLEVMRNDGFVLV